MELGSRQQQGGRGAQSKTKPRKEEESNPKRGHHVFNNVPNLVCESIDDFFKPNIGALTNDRDKTYQTFSIFYQSLSASDKESLLPIYTDYYYWQTDHTVNAERNKIVVYTNPERTTDKQGEPVDENTERWTNAKTAMRYFHALGRDKSLTHHFKGITLGRATNQLLEGYIDKGAERQYLRQYNETETYLRVKDTLRMRVRGLPARVEQWCEALKAYNESKPWLSGVELK